MVLLTARENRNESVLCKKKLCLLVCLSTAVVSLAVAALTFVFDPIQIITQMRMRISHTSEVFEFLKTEVDSVHVSVYLFNITNAERFMSGEDHKLQVEEVGPITYRERRVNEDLELNADATEVRYTPRVTPEFVPEESIGNPEDIVVTMLNLPMMGVSSTIGKYSFFPRTTLNMLVRQLSPKPVVTIDAHSYLWGYSDALISLANTVMPGVIPFEKLGILDRYYDQKTTSRLVLGATDEDKLMIKTRNGFKKLVMNPNVNVDDCELCDTFENTYEGVLYPSPISPETPISLFRTGICKVLGMDFHEKRILENNVVGLVFNLSDGFFSLNGSRHNDGLLDLSECFYTLPISLSKVNFKDMDPKLYERIEGLKPNPAHKTQIIIEPIMGIEIDTLVNIQLNMVLKDITSTAEASKFSNMVVPICYVDIKQSKMTENTVQILRLVYINSPIYLLTVQLLLVLVGLVSLGYSARLLHHRRRRRGQGMAFPVFTTVKPSVIHLRVGEPLIGNGGR